MRDFFYDFDGETAKSQSEVQPVMHANGEEKEAASTEEGEEEDSVDLGGSESDSDEGVEELIKKVEKEMKASAATAAKEDKVPYVRRYWDAEEEQDTAKAHTCGICGEVGHTMKECSHEQTPLIKLETVQWRNSFVPKCEVALVVESAVEIILRTYVCPTIWRVYDTVGAVGLDPNSFVVKSCYNCAGDDHFGDNCPLPRGHPLKYGDPSAFNDLAIPYNTPIAPPTASSSRSNLQWNSQPPPSHRSHPSSNNNGYKRNTASSSNNNSSKRPLPIPDEDDWFEKRARLSSSALDPKKGRDSGLEKAPKGPKKGIQERRTGGWNDNGKGKGKEGQRSSGARWDSTEFWDGPPQRRFDPPGRGRRGDGWGESLRDGGKRPRAKGSTGGWDEGSNGEGGRGREWDRGRRKWDDRDAKKRTADRGNGGGGGGRNGVNGNAPRYRGGYT
ncbi:hypothetical protein BT69DRAFT_1352377 [Atractiella rhizophila]|nr:hypothetical protein BT69DRAFT_1352377 [Atractiella rhizophila]